jgi:cell division protein FtsI (penicillin-binding protein 3)
VISTLTAAEMRQMMEGVVLYGTGKPAQLNGYSSAGKTGTAQKVDPVTHLYSKTMHIASFAGFAPVNNPVISVAVVIDSPKGDYYGTAVSAPVFAEVAQQVLEYLGVPHDIELRPQNEMAKAMAPVSEDDEQEDQSNVDALYAAVNDLPADDPLRTSQPPSAAPDAGSSDPARKIPLATETTSQGASAKPSLQVPINGSPKPGAQLTAQIKVQDGKQLTVPSLVGLSVRRVIETAAAAGLDVQILGAGTAREQAPAPGTQVPQGTRVVVRCDR